MKRRPIKFCPVCGSNKVVRDTFNPAAINKDGQQVDHGLKAYVCNSCFEGFVIKPSPRSEFVLFMIRTDTRGIKQR